MSYFDRFVLAIVCAVVVVVALAVGMWWFFKVEITSFWTVLTAGLVGGVLGWLISYVIEKRFQNDNDAEDTEPEVDEEE